MRIKPAGIIIVLVIIAALAYFAFRPKTADVNNGSTTVNTTEQTDNLKNPPPAATKTTGGNEREFNYTAGKPVNGTLKGVVELGATGFNSFVINMDSKKNW